MHTVAFLSYSYSYYHRSTGIKVYSSDINDQNGANHIYFHFKLAFKITFVIYNVDYILTNRYKLTIKKNCHGIIYSRDVLKNADPFSNETSDVFMSESLKSFISL